MLAFLLALCTVQPCLATTVAGDSVIVTVAVADNVVAQTVSVDSVRVRLELTPITNSQKTTTLAKVAGTMTFRFAYPLSLWAPGQTLGGPINVWLGHNGSGCAPSACWSNVTTKGSGSNWAWGYTLDASKPNPADGAAITVPSVGLN